MTPSLEGWQTKAKEAPSPHEVRMTLPDTKNMYKVPEKIIMPKIQKKIPKNTLSRNYNSNSNNIIIQ